MILCVIRLGSPLWRGMGRLSQLTRGLASSLSFALSTGRPRSSLGEFEKRQRKLMKKTISLYSIRLTVRADDGVHQSDINVLITVRYPLFKPPDNNVLR